MKILFAGINHFDPLCRRRLEGWLASIRLPMETEPDFVGLEWDSHHFEEVRQARPAFRRDLSQEFSQLSDPQLDILELSLGFEGDSHESVYPAVERVWMNEGHRSDTYPAERIDLLRAVLVNNGVDHDDPDVFAHWCKLLRLAGRPDGQPHVWGLDHDEEKTEVVRQHVVVGNNRWALIVIGANHTVCSDIWMCGKLANEGHVCLSHGLW